MQQLLRSTSVLLLAGLFAAGSGTAQPASPGTPMPASGATAAPRPQQKPKNLKVLPSDTDIRAVMHQYEADLGVHCSFCHAGADPTTHRTDFASDDNAMKNAARFMIQMTADLNTKYLAQMPMRSFGDTITCGTCHRGKYRPPSFVAPPEAEGNHAPMAPPQAPSQGAPGVSAPTGSSR